MWLLQVFLQRYNNPVTGTRSSSGDIGVQRGGSTQTGTAALIDDDDGCTFGFKAQRAHGSLRASTFIVTRRVGVAHRAPQKRTVQIQSCQSSNDLIPRTRHAMTGIKTVLTDTANPPTASQPSHP
jgi:hypothetical protein